MTESERVAAVLKRIRERCGPGFEVTDPTWLSKIRAAHADGGMPEDADVSVVLRRPASPEAMTELETLVRERFSRELPEGLRAFLSACDGLFLCEAHGVSQDEFYEPGLMSTAHILRAMRDVLRTETHPDGRVVNVYWPFVPFFEVPDLAFHAVDLSGPGERILDWEFGSTYPEDTTEISVLAVSFGEWLERFVESGMNPYFAIDS